MSCVRVIDMGKVNEVITALIHEYEENIALLRAEWERNDQSAQPNADISKIIERYELAVELLHNIKPRLKNEG